MTDGPVFFCCFREEKRSYAIIVLQASWLLLAVVGLV